MINARSILAIGMLVATSMTAHASDTWRFTLSGAGIVIPGGAVGCNPQTSDCPPLQVDWNGALVVTTTGHASGTYTGADITAVDFVSNVLDIHTDGFDTGSVFPDWPSIVIDNGHVTGLHIYFADAGWDAFTAEGTTVAWSSEEGTHDGSAELRGTLRAVPEPGSMTLSLMGFAVLALGARRRIAARR